MVLFHIRVRKLKKDVEGEIREHVWAYANQDLFFDSFVGSAIKMGNSNVITREEERRKNYRYVNT